MDKLRMQKKEPAGRKNGERRLFSSVNLRMEHIALVEEIALETGRTKTQVLGIWSSSPTTTSSCTRREKHEREDQQSGNRKRQADQGGKAGTVRQWSDHHRRQQQSGKTSVLDAIAWALGGDKYKPTAAARDGAYTDPILHVELSNGLIVERKGKNSSLKVIDPNGNKAGSSC